MVLLARTAGVLLALGSAFTCASPVQQTRQQDSGSYDFIIVGGGTAGLALAARLTEDGKTTALVLEAGGPPDQVAASKAPGADLQVLGSPIDWGFTTLPQESLNGRQLTYNRGRCLGGSSALNGLTYGRGSSSLYDLWESLGNAGWGWDEVLPFFKKVCWIAVITVTARTHHDHSRLRLLLRSRVLRSRTSMRLCTTKDRSNSRILHM